MDKLPARSGGVELWDGKRPAKGSSRPEHEHDKQWVEPGCDISHLFSSMRCCSRDGAIRCDLTASVSAPPSLASDRGPAPCTPSSSNINHHGMSSPQLAAYPIDSCR